MSLYLSPGQCRLHVSDPPKGEVQAKKDFERRVGLHAPVTL